MRRRTPVHPFAAAVRLIASAAVLLAFAPMANAAAATGDKQPAATARKPVPAASARPAAPIAPVVVPADVRARIVARLPGAQASDVAVSPVPGLYEVTMGGLIAYVSADGKYLLSGNVYDLDTQVNLTASRQNAARARALAAASESNMIVYGPANAKMTVTVFTDVDCGFCRRFHSQIADVNKAGVRVRYMFYPRTGPGTESWTKSEQVWCAADRRDALTRAKRGEAIKSKTCGDAAVKSQYDLGSDLGVEGTPAIFTQNGDYIGGYLTPTELVQAIQESQKSAGAGR
ncbi:MAG: DsbC family protein [Gammaproteobacteria bacterium]|nr:DsbC family protein [Gammaproteobacteria bacterium]MDH4310591.1 DsbC family protein [Gammaproteobacteria bacterium]